LTITNYEEAKISFSADYCYTEYNGCLYYIIFIPVLLLKILTSNILELMSSRKHYQFLIRKAYKNVINAVTAKSSIISQHGSILLHYE